MPVSGNERASRKKKINHSNSFRNQYDEVTPEPFKRDDELRHSTGSMRGHYGVNNRSKTDISLKYPIKGEGTSGHSLERSNMNGKRSGSNDSQISDKEEPNTPSHSVSQIIRGFESKSGSSERKETSRYLTPVFGSYEDNSEYEVTEKHKRNGSKRKLSIRKRGKSNNDASVTILQKLGIAPFMGSENRNAKKALSHFDVQSVLFDIETAAVLKAQYADGGIRPKNISTGASAASARAQRKKREGSDGNLEKSRTESIIDDGDGTSNELVESCPYFRNEVGTIEEKESNNVNKFLGKYRGVVSSGRIWTSMGKNRTPSLELLHTTDNDNDPFFGGTPKLNEIDQQKDVTILETIEDGSKIALWDRPKKSTEKRIFDFEHVDMGAMYYREFFLGKEHQNLQGIDEKYGPICISIIRENIEKMAVLGHVKEHTKHGTNKYQYRIILRTTELQTFRGTVLEESIPSAVRHGTSRALPTRDILEFCFPELQISCLRTAIAGPKVAEHLQKLDEQQLSLQFKVGLLYCKAGQSSEEDMYNNEHHGPAFDEFMDIIGEKVLLKGFEGYKAQLDNKNDSTGIYSLYTKFHNREIMFHVSTLLPWTPNNKQQLLRKRHIGNDIVTVIFQEPGAEPFTPKNIRSHFQHVFIVVRVESPNTNNTSYKVAVSRSQDVPEFGPPIPPESSFRNNKAFKDFLLSKIINAENAAHKAQKFTAMAVRTRYEYLKDLATNFVTTQTIESGGAKFSKFNPMSLSVKKKEKIHPPCSPEVWCQAGLVWSVKVDIENAPTARLCFMAISTKVIGLIDKVTKEIVVSIPCKAVIGWRSSGYSMRLYYNNGQGLNLSLVEDDGNEMAFVINRLKAVTPGCETQDMSLRRSGSGQLGFHVFYEGLVAEVEPYAMAWQAGLRKGSRLLEISNRLVGKMSHDRMIQALRKPGSIRVVVLPPLPDGQPRNYKSTRNLKRYSSMTSVYSERIADLSDSSASSSSKENVALDFDTITPIRVGGGREITTVEARVRQSTPHSVSRQSNNHRPQGFILDSDQSLEFTEASSAEHILSSSGASGELAGIKRVNGLASKATNNSALTATHNSAKQLLEKKLSSKINERNMTKKDLKESTSNSSSIGSVDPELSELERTISDTRKSIDAKFYKSLVQSAMVRKTREQNSRNAVISGKVEQKPPLPQGLQTASTRLSNDGQCKGGTPVSIVRGTTPQEEFQRAGNFVPLTRPEDELQAASSQDESIKGSTSSLSRLRSPPPYEEAITSLERRRSKKIKPSKKDSSKSQSQREVSSPPLHSSDSSKEEKPKVLMRAISDERRRYRSEVKSANLEERIGPKGILGETPKVRSRKLPYDFISNRTGLMIAKSESNIFYSCDKEPGISDSEDRLRSGNIVHTRVRDVNDVIKEKIHVRSESADQLISFSSLMPKASRRASSTEPPRSGSGSTPRNLSRKTSPDRSPLGTPYSSHQGRLTKSQEDIMQLLNTESEQDCVPFKETTLGPTTTTIETYGGIEENLNDTFAKIDQAFGFTSYGTAPAKTPTKDEKRRKRPKSLRQRARSSQVFSDTSDDESTGSSLNSTGSHKRTPSGRPRGRSHDKGKPTSQDSMEKKKSEAEESLEAAITEFHSTLSNLPDKQSSLARVSSPDEVNRTPTPLDKGYSKAPTDEETPKIRRSISKPSENTTVNIRRDSKEFNRGGIQISRKTITYPDSKSRIYVRSQSSRQSSLDSPSHSSKDSGSRVQELVGKFSQPPQPSSRKSSLDSSSPTRGSPERYRSKSEARISVLTSPSPWIRRDQSQSAFKVNEANSVRRFEKHRISHAETTRQNSAEKQTESPYKKKMSLTVRPTLDTPKEVVDTVGPLPVIPNSPSWLEACERGMSSLPGRGKKNGQKLESRVVDVSLSVRGLDLAPQRSEELTASSKEDLRLMLSVLSGELVKEKSENERLLEELQLARIEKEQLLEQSKAASSQLRKFTSWFYDSMSNRNSPHFDGN